MPLVAGRASLQTDEASPLPSNSRTDIEIDILRIEAVKNHAAAIGQKAGFAVRSGFTTTGEKRQKTQNRI